jgi:hypothetical protein
MKKKQDSSNPTKWLVFKIAGGFIILSYGASTFIDRYIFPVPNLRDWIITNINYSRYATISIFLIFLLIFALYQIIIDWFERKEKIIKLKKLLTAEKENKLFTDFTALSSQELEELSNFLK